MCSLLGVVYLLACPSLKWHLTKKEQKTPHEISTTHKIMNYPDWPSQLVIRKRVIQYDPILDQIPFIFFKTFTLGLKTLQSYAIFFKAKSTQKFMINLIVGYSGANYL